MVTKKLKKHHDSLLTREKLILLALMNTLQPISAAKLRELLSSQFSEKNLRKALTALQTDKQVARLKDRTYYLTERGREGLGSGPLARERDRSRMLYLIDKHKEGERKS